MISGLSAVAEIERENTRVQTMEGRMQKAREGKWNPFILKTNPCLFNHLIRTHLQEMDVVLCFQSVPEGSQMLLHKNPQMMQKAREGKWKRAN